MVQKSPLQSVCVPPEGREGGRGRGGGVRREEREGRRRGRGREGEKGGGGMMSHPVLSHTQALKV